MVKGDDAGAVGQIGQNHLANGTQGRDDGGEKTFGMGGVDDDGGGGGRGGDGGGGTHVCCFKWCLYEIGSPSG